MNSHNYATHTYLALNCSSINSLFPDACEENLLRKCPSDQMVALGENVTLSCELTQAAEDEGVVLEWIIVVNGTLYNAHQRNLDELERFNFFLEDEEFGASLTLTVEAAAANNNSQINCRLTYVPAEPHVRIANSNLTAVGELGIRLISYWCNCSIFVLCFVL